MNGSPRIVSREGEGPSPAIDGFAGLRTGTARAFLLAPGIAALGCVAGVAFVLIRGGRPPSDDSAAEGGRT